MTSLSFLAPVLIAASMAYFIGGKTFFGTPAQTDYWRLMKSMLVLLVADRTLLDIPTLNPADVLDPSVRMSLWLSWSAMVAVGLAYPMQCAFDFSRTAAARVFVTRRDEPQL